MPLGDAILALTATDPEPFGPPPSRPGETVEDLVRSVPCIRRLEVLARRCGEHGVLVDEAIRIMQLAAPTTSHRAGILEVRTVLALLLGAAVDTDLFDLAGSTVRLGAQGHLLLTHPTAAWWEATQHVLFSDPLTIHQPIEGSAVLLPLLLQHVVKGGEVPLAACLAPLCEELRTEAGARHGRPPSQRSVRRQIATMVGILEELGLVRWRPDGERLGTAQPTLLGGFGWMLLHTRIDGPSPEVLALLGEHGYLPAADGMVVHRDDIPAPICDS